MGLWDWLNVVIAFVSAGFMVWSNDRPTRVIFVTPLVMSVAHLVR